VGTGRGLILQFTVFNKEKTNWRDFAQLPASANEPGVARGLLDFYEQQAIPADSFACAALAAMTQPEDVDLNESLFRQTPQDD